MKRSGTADLPLHGGRVPAWLAERMTSLGTAIAANFNAGVLLYLLARRIGGLDGARVLRAFLKILIASAVMGVAAYYAEALLHQLFPDPWWLPRAIRVGGAIAVAFATLALAAALLRIEEFAQVRRRLLRR